MVLDRSSAPPGVIASASAISGENARVAAPTERRRDARIEERAVVARRHLRLSSQPLLFLSGPSGIGCPAIALVNAVLRFPSCVAIKDEFDQLYEEGALAADDGGVAPRPHLKTCESGPMQRCLKI